MIPMPTANNNPLSSFMRQPKIYIRLPSNGEYWPSGSLLMPENKELPVYSMTAKDELLLKIPDALMNGQAIVDVIQNCIPNIKNAWEMPSIDVDLILIAIRLATYGEMMKTPITLPDTELEYQVDLRLILDEIVSKFHWEPVIPISSELTVYIKPLNYRHMTEASISLFETEKIISLANNNSLKEEEKIEAFKQSFRKLTDVTINTITKSIVKIDSVNGSTTEYKHIKEFVDNCDKDIFNKIQGHIEQMKIVNSLNPIKIELNDELREKGYTSDIEVPLVFDPTTFFG